jgi:predicted DCC family thiol-disulfide oxidoreductase YuxK
MKKLTFPETMLVMLEQSQAKVKELRLALEQAQETIDRLSMVAQTEQQAADEAKALINVWRKIAGDLVYTEHDDYSHLHSRKEDPCVRCVAHNAYHEQVNREANP